MSLPVNAIILGKGGTFKVPLGGFHGWMRVDDDAWVEDFCSGKTACMEYAAHFMSDVVAMNTKTFQKEEIPFIAVVDEYQELLDEKQSGEISAAELINACCKWTSPMPTPTEDQIIESMVSIPHVPSCEPDWSGVIKQMADEFDAGPQPINQSDPHGIPQHEPGAKNDKGKMMASLVFNFPRALWAIGEVGTYGARKYTRDGWEKVPDGVRRYADAEVRHLLLGKMEELDQESGLPHEWHRLWNALASLELSLR